MLIANCIAKVPFILSKRQLNSKIFIFLKTYAHAIEKQNASFFGEQIMHRLF